MAIVLRDIVHDASHVDQEKRDAQFSFWMHACGAVPMIMVLRLPAQGPWEPRYYILHISPNGLNIKNNQTILFCLVHKTSYSIK